MTDACGMSIKFKRETVAVAMIAAASTVAPFGAPTQAAAMPGDCVKAPVAEAKGEGLQHDVDALYRAGLGRAADEQGLQYWVDVAEADGLRHVAWGLKESREFDLRFGELTDDEYVEGLYCRVLGRKPDEEGAKYWRTKIAEGADPSEVLIWFSQSLEAGTPEKPDGDSEVIHPLPEKPDGDSEVIHPLPEKPDGDSEVIHPLPEEPDGDSEALIPVPERVIEPPIYELPDADVLHD